MTVRAFSFGYSRATSDQFDPAKRASVKPMLTKSCDVHGMIHATLGIEPRPNILFRAGGFPGSHGPQRCILEPG